jgi:hypothetical protein
MNSREQQDRKNARQRERYASDPEWRRRKLARQRERYATDVEYRERKCELARKQYDNLTGVQYNSKLLNNRRWSALARISARREKMKQERKTEWLDIEKKMKMILSGTGSGDK